VDKVALGQVFSEYLGFPCQIAFYRLLHNHHLSSGTGTVNQTVAAVPSGFTLTPLEKNNIVTCLLKAGIAETEQTSVTKQLLCKHLSAVKMIQTQH
jgi:hypothetical protein